MSERDRKALEGYFARDYEDADGEADGTEPTEAGRGTAYKTGVEVYARASVTWTTRLACSGRTCRAK